MKSTLLTYPRVAALCVAALITSLNAQTETTPTSKPVAPDNDFTVRTDSDLTTRANVNVNTNGKLSHSDRTFIEKTTERSAKDVAVSNAVAAKLTGPGLSELSRTIVSEHTALNTELRALATRKGFTFKADDDTSDEANRWAKNNKDVNDEYLEEMKDDHEALKDVFERGAKTEDAEIAAFASKHLPKIVAHLEHIKSLDKKN